MKSETDLKSELDKAISISMAKPKSEQGEKIWPSLEKEMSFCKTTYKRMPTLKVLLAPLVNIQLRETSNERSPTSGRFSMRQRLSRNECFACLNFSF